MSLDPVETLQKLIQTPSVNPMGRDVVGPTIGESRMTALLAEICEQHDWPYRRMPVHPGRDNLMVLIAGRPSPSEGGELLLWDVHQDTVPADGMTVAPFAGEIQDGRVYGRGACDVKGAMAAMLAALSRLSERSLGGGPERPTIVLACTVNEECGFSGARALAETWMNCPDVLGGREATEEPSRTGGFFPRMPDAAIVAEPTDFDVVVAHQGQVRWRCHTIGRAAHSSRPDMGVNAIYGMSRVVCAIERYHKQLCDSAPEHPLCGRPSACVSTVHGGIGINTVPDRATIEIDHRIGPNDVPAAARAELVRYIAEHVDIGGCRVEHDPAFMQSTGLSDSNNRAVAEQLAKIVQSQRRRCELMGAPYGTDAAAVVGMGVPTVVFGPGSIDQAHTSDEYISIGELGLATEVFYQIACQGLCSSPALGSQS